MNELIVHKSTMSGKSFSSIFCIVQQYPLVLGCTAAVNYAHGYHAVYRIVESS